MSDASSPSPPGPKPKITLRLWLIAAAVSAIAVSLAYRSAQSSLANERAGMSPEEAAGYLQGYVFASLAFPLLVALCSLLFPGRSRRRVVVVYTVVTAVSALGQGFSLLFAASRL